MSSAPVGTSVAGQLAELRGQPRRNRHAARADADERQSVETAVALEDLVRDAGEGPRHAVRVHHDCHDGLVTDGMTRNTGSTD